MNASQKANLTGGIVLFIFGFLLLLDRLGINIPKWLFSWEMFLIVLGLLILIKNEFKSFAGYVLISIGGIFLLKDYFPDLINTRLILPILIMSYGAYLIYKSIRISNYEQSMIDSAGEEGKERINFITSSALFGSTSRKILTDEFKGGDLTSTFGSVKVNLSGCSIKDDETAVLNCEATFGSIELIIPKDWAIINELTTAFGELEDLRGEVTTSRGKLKITGNCFFGNVKIFSA